VKFALRAPGKAGAPAWRLPAAHLPGQPFCEGLELCGPVSAAVASKRPHVARREEERALQPKC